jgi:dihydroorotase
MMSETFDCIVKGGTLVNHDGMGQRDIGIRDGKIAAIGTFAQSSAAETIDCTGLHLLPGVVDTQVHFREPGLTHKEDLESGSRGAVLGGVTAVFEMPNTNPATTNAAALEDKLKRAHHRMHCDFAFWMGGTHDNVSDIPDLERLPGVPGIKVFMGSSTGSLLVEDDAGVRAILQKTRRRAAFHSEDEYMLRERVALRVPGDPSSHPVWRSPDVALHCTKRLIAIAEECRARIHVLHISTAEELPLLAAHKGFVSAEVTPHHLTLDGTEAYQRLGTYVQMNPPIRDAATRQKLWRGLAGGILDILGSDHAPHTREEKDHPYPQSHSGMTGVQTLVPIMLDHVAQGRLSLQRFVDMTSAGPARLFGMASKGRIAIGYDADLTIVDLGKIRTIRNDWIASRVGWTPYDGMSVTGWPIGTIIRGKRVMWEDEILMPGQGEAVQFN